MAFFGEIRYAIFSHFFALRLGGSLFNRLAPSEPPATGTSARTSANDHENRPVLTNAQIVLLKLFDSYLYFGAAGYGDSLAGRQEVSGQTFDFAAASTSSVMDRDCVLLISAFLRLATFAEDAMRRSGSGGSGSGESRINSADSASEPNQSGGNGDAGAGAGYGSEPDHRLVGVYKALILLLQCLISLSLAAEGRDQNPESTAQSRARGNADAQIPFEEAKPYQQEAVRVLTALRSSTNGVVERLVCKYPDPLPSCCQEMRSTNSRVQHAHAINPNLTFTCYFKNSLFASNLALCTGHLSLPSHSFRARSTGSRAKFNRRSSSSTHTLRSFKCASKYSRQSPRSDATRREIFRTRTGTRTSRIQLRETRLGPSLGDLGLWPERGRSRSGEAERRTVRRAQHDTIGRAQSLCVSLEA